MRKFSDAELELALKVGEVMDPDGPIIVSCPPDMLSNWIRANLLEHDCLEFLREQEYYDELEIEIDYTCNPPVSITAHKFDDYLRTRGAETLLEALYSLIVE